MRLLLLRLASVTELPVVTVQKDDVAQKVQQVELAACSSSSAIISPVELDTAPLPPVPPELSRLMPSGEGCRLTVCGTAPRNLLGRKHTCIPLMPTYICHCRCRSVAGLPAFPATPPHSKLPPEAEASLQRLKAELAHSQAAYRTVLRALHRKVPLCGAAPQLTCWELTP